MKEAISLDKNTLISELTKSPHGDYKAYVPVCQKAAQQEPEFLAHLICYNREHGQIRDSKIALPVISLRTPGFTVPEFIENSLAHLALLDPRNLMKTVRFFLEVRSPGNYQAFRRMVTAYLRYREADFRDRWEPTAIRYRGDLKDLYRLFHVKPDDRANRILFGGEYPAGSVFAEVAALNNMSASDAAACIIRRKIPFLTAKRAMGKRIGEPDVLMALIERMSPTELVTSMKELEKLGMKNLPAVRGAFDKALARSSGSKQNVLKTTKAVESVEDETLKEKLRGLQEKQIKKVATIDGDWLVLGDKSGSMASAIEAARHVAGTLAKLVKGKVYLIFFDTAPRFMDVTGKTYEEIVNMTKAVSASGGTSIGVGLNYILERKLTVDGIAVVSDAQENTAPFFPERYARYVQVTGNEPPVYLYRCGVKPRFSGERDLQDAMKLAGLDLQVFELGDSVDYYSITNISATMNTKRYGLIDQIMDMPLIKLGDVFDGSLQFKRSKKGKKQHA